MLLHSISLSQFRSYTKQLFTFSPRVTVVVGKNTAGKTNLVEAIYMLATGKSFRADQDREVVRWREEICRIKTGDADTSLEIMLTTGSVGGAPAPLKRYSVNGVPRRMVDFVGHFRAVLFWPEHLELVTDSPSIRRKYLDSVLVQVDREYRRNLLSYERGLRQRNKLLDLINEGKGSSNQLLFWNQLLIKSGAYLTDTRADFIASVNRYSIPGSVYRIEYDKSVISETRLFQYANEEVAARATLVGPHRDDYAFQIHDARLKTKNEESTEYRDLRTYGSRGEQRMAVLWLKLAEVVFIEEITGERPTLLLDDVFSELDEPHRRQVLDVVSRLQTIITSAEDAIVDLLHREYPTGVSVIQLKTNA